MRISLLIPQTSDGIKGERQLDVLCDRFNEQSGCGYLLVFYSSSLSYFSFGFAGSDLFVRDLLEASAE